MKLFINSFDIDLDESKPIARTLQVNDIANLQSRQSNFSPTFNIPKTQKNINSFRKLGIVGINSQIPYQRNSVRLFNDNGECVILDGWAVINEVSDVYRCNIYDGNIDLWKSIENKTLSDLDLTAINHNKTLQSVIESWNDASLYKYILADYNGKMDYSNGNIINIDYLIPSAKVSYLWVQIFNTYGYTFEGSVFNTFDFQNLWLTYGKELGGDAEPPKVEIYNNTSFDTGITGINEVDLVHLNPAPTQGQFVLPANIDYVVEFTGSIVITNTLNFDVEVDQLPPFDGSPFFVEGDLQVYINNVLVNSNLTNTQTIQVNQGDVLSFKISVDDNLEIQNVIFIGGGLVFEFIEGFIVDFNDSFIEFKIRDFISEILNRFSLTPFKDKYSNHYRFLTLDERLQTSNIIDWSDKFIEVDKTNYTFGAYAQKNNFTYKYNDQEGDYYDGAINVNNVNLPDEKNVFNSLIYSPESETGLINGTDSNIYKFWDKEIKEDGTIKYKGLKKRFYFLRFENVSFETAQKIGSEVLLIDDVFNVAPFERWTQLRMLDIIGKYYSNYQLILQDSQLVNARINLSEIDFNDIDLTELVYIKQLANYYLINKVKNYVSGVPTIVELIRVRYTTEIFTNQFNILISLENVDVDTACLNLTFQNDFELNYFNIQYSTDNGINWSDNFVNLNATRPPYCLPYVQNTLYRVFNPFTGQIESNILNIDL